MIELLILIVVLGFVAWLVMTVVPMAEPLKTIFVAVIGLIALLAVLNAFGIIGGGNLLHFRCS